MELIFSTQYREAQPFFGFVVSLIMSLLFFPFFFFFFLFFLLDYARLSETSDYLASEDNMVGSYYLFLHKVDVVNMLC